MSTLLTDIQLGLADRIKSDPFFNTLPVLHERKADIVTEINNSLGVLTQKGGKIGACVIVMSPVARDEFEGVTFGPMELDLTILVLEDVVINTDATNGTLLAALTIARRLVDILKHFASAGFHTPLIPAEPTIVPVENPLAPVAYEVRFVTRESHAATIAKVAAPTISPASGAAPQTITLSSTTAGASIYYTLDGTFPYAGNPTAVLYSGPFQVLTAATLRAAAYKADTIGSDINRAAYT